VLLAIGVSGGTIGVFGGTLGLFGRGIGASVAIVVQSRQRLCAECKKLIPENDNHI
jgi:hypothetical protein